MTNQNTQNTIKRLQSEIQTLQKHLANEAKKEAQISDKIIRANQRMSGAKSQNTIKSRMREIDRLNKALVNLQKRKADINKKIAGEITQLHKYQQELSKKQEVEQKKTIKALEKQNRDLQKKQDAILHQVNLSTPKSGGFEQLDAVEYDAFISHATEDKEALVRPLAGLLQKAGFNIWYDDFQLSVGDSLRRSIDKGLANSRFGIVILSPSFFAKNWTQYELDGLVAKEMINGKVILPIWHKVSKDEVFSYSPSLSDKVALNTALFTLQELVEKLSDVMR